METKTYTEMTAEERTKYRIEMNRAMELRAKFFKNSKNAPKLAPVPTVGGTRREVSTAFTIRRMF